MAKGKTQNWQDVLEVLTGSREISAKPFLKFFEPLEKHLDHVISKNDLKIGWIRWEMPKNSLNKKNKPKPKGEKNAATMLNINLLFIIILQLLNFY